jgi:hypothetical protein
VVPNFDNKKARAINRVEVDTQFDLTKIQQVRKGILKEAIY